MSKSLKIKRIQKPKGPGYLLRKFSFFFQAFSLIPLLVLVYLYMNLTPGEPGRGVSQGQLGLIIVLLAFVSLLGFVGMRRILGRVSFFSETVREVLSGDEPYQAVQELTKEEGEVAELAEAFGNIIEQLKTNVEELKHTKSTLQNTLTKVADVVSSTEDVDVLCRLVLDTAVEAIAAERAVIFSYDGENFVTQTHTEIQPRLPEELLLEAEPYLARLMSEDQLFYEKPSEGEADYRFLSAPLICCPLNYRGRFRGGICISGKRFQHGFSEDDLKLIANLSHQIAALLENAELNDEREQTYFETMAALVHAVEARDRYSSGHSARVGAYAIQIGETLGLSSEDLMTIDHASKLHDIGKIGISDTILLKPGPLTTAEVEIMKRHPVIGENIVRPLKTFRALLHPIRHHHEFLDGSGYPDGLKADEITEITRIMVVADVFDALTTDRPYRPAMARSDAVKILLKMVADGKIDHEAVAALKGVIIDQNFVPSSDLLSPGIARERSDERVAAG
ncbi:MAG: HD domain-containing protein [Acidobacteriota bacterium]|nr:MAG: HD domain-containing protein [Acidobacteriota bacterium]